MLAFFFACRGRARGTSEEDEADARVLTAGGCADAKVLTLGGCAAGGGCRRLLKEDMNSKACGESPNRFLRCSAAPSFGSVSV